MQNTAKICYGLIPNLHLVCCFMSLQTTLWDIVHVSHVIGTSTWYSGWSIHLGSLRLRFNSPFFHETHWGKPWSHSLLALPTSQVLQGFNGKRVWVGLGLWGREFSGVYCHKFYLPKKSFSLWGLIHVAWTSAVIPRDPLPPRKG